MVQYPFDQSSWGRAKQDTISAQKTVRFMWGGEGVLAVAGGTWLAQVASLGAPTLEIVGRSVIGGLGGLLTAILIIFVWNLFRAPYKQRNEARNMMEQLLRTRFYLKFESIAWKLISKPLEPFKGSTSFKLTISNQENAPKSVSRFMLEIELENGDKKELPAMNPDGKTEADITLYLQPHESKIVWLNFVYEVKPIQGSEKLYVFDDLGAWCRVPINADTMVTMAKQSTSRSGDYHIL